MSDRVKITLNHQVTLAIQAIRLKTPRHYLIFAGQPCPKKDDHIVGVQLMMNHQATMWYDVDINKITFRVIGSSISNITHIYFVTLLGSESNIL